MESRLKGQVSKGMFYKQNKSPQAMESTDTQSQGTKGKNIKKGVRGVRVSYRSHHPKPCPSKPATPPPSQSY